MPKLSKPPKPVRARVDLSIKGVAKHWAKTAKRPKEDVAAVVSKVGNDPDTVMKELRTNRSGKPPRQKSKAK